MSIKINTTIELANWYRAAKFGDRCVYYSGYLAMDLMGMKEHTRELAHTIRKWGTSTRAEVFKTHDKSGDRGMGLGYLFSEKVRDFDYRYIFVKA